MSIEEFFREDNIVENTNKMSNPKPNDSNQKEDEEIKRISEELASESKEESKPEEQSHAVRRDTDKKESRKGKVLAKEKKPQCKHPKILADIKKQLKDIPLHCNVALATPIDDERYSMCCDGIDNLMNSLSRDAQRMSRQVKGNKILIVIGDHCEVASR